MNSILLQNTSTLKKSVQDKILFNDLNYNGIDDNDEVKVLNEKCILQAYKIWIQSDVYDYDRKPDFGGFITRNVIKKPMNESSCRAIEDALFAETSSKWPGIELVKCSVSYSLLKRQWLIKVAIRDKTTGLTDMSMFNEGTSIAVDAT